MCYTTSFPGTSPTRPGNEVVCYIVEATVMVQFYYFKSLHLGIETVSFTLMLQMARMDMD